MMRRGCLAALLACSIPSVALSGLIQGAAAEATVGVVKGVAQAAAGDDEARRTKPKTTPASARRIPVKAQPMPFDPRLIVFPYTPDYIYPIPAKLDTYTHLQLAENERVIGFYLADKLRWNFKVAATKRDVFVKPVMPESTTPATLITSLRRYELSLSVGGEDDGGVWYQRVSWEADEGSFEAATEQPGLAAPSGALPPLRAEPTALAASPPARPQAGVCGQERVQVDRLNFNYGIVGEATFKPTMVFDDGRFTWIKFPKLQTIPPLFALDPATGEAQIEPFVPCRGHHLVQGLLPGGALLKLGREEVRIINKSHQDCGGGGLFGLFQPECRPVANIRDN